uniref:Uncharacterized protein n=1 Tax=Romanomermis culicivorax TaxID=13658 RepID=A0A915JQH9_ROMCU
MPSSQLCNYPNGTKILMKILPIQPRQSGNITWLAVRHPVDRKLHQEIAMQIDELDDQRRKHLHGNGAPQRDQK